jgi:hypothetical protein
MTSTDLEPIMMENDLSSMIIRDILDRIDPDRIDNIDNSGKYVSELSRQVFNTFEMEFRGLIEDYINENFENITEVLNSENIEERILDLVSDRLCQIGNLRSLKINNLLPIEDTWQELVDRGTVTYDLGTWLVIDWMNTVTDVYVDKTWVQMQVIIRNNYGDKTVRIECVKSHYKTGGQK